MKRPFVITVIGCCFLVAGVYLCSISAVILIAPGHIQTLKAAPFVFALRRVSPYATLFVGAVWATIGWGLFQLREWARFVASLMLGAGVAWALITLLLHRHSAWRTFLICFEITLRSAAVW